MTDNVIASLAGAILALLFGYVPGVAPVVSRRSSRRARRR
jgi:hypothetical protein